MIEIPDDIRKTSEEVAEVLLTKAVLIVGIDDRQQFQPKLARAIIETAILAERQRHPDTYLSSRDSFDQAMAALRHAREKMWEYGFPEDDLQPIRNALARWEEG